MLIVEYSKLIPYTFATVLEQYFDFEHIAHVHPKTLGEYVVMEQSRERIVYDQHWPANRRGRRATSRIVQTFQPPGEIWFEFVSGKHQGTRVHSRLVPVNGGTEVIERYSIPGLPNWPILRWLIRPSVVRQVDRIWREDLDVAVCVGGWPGTPDGFEHWKPAWSNPRPGTYRIGKLDDFPVGRPTLITVDGGKFVVLRSTDDCRAMHAVCPHTGGPLELGIVDENCLVCPWHGARFDIATGAHCGGSPATDVCVYPVVIDGGEVVVSIPD